MFENANMIILKVTKDCNLRCKYCYVANKDAYRGTKIDFEIFKKIIDKIFLDKQKMKFIETQRLKKKFIALGPTPNHLSIVFHGGEPTCIGPEELTKQCIYIKNKEAETGVRVSLSMQTNGTLLSEEMLRVIQQYDIQLGMSFDGAFNGSNTLRTYKDVSFYEDTSRKCAAHGIQPGFLMVVNKQNAPFFEENIEYMVENLHQNATKANYVEDTNNLGNIEISGEDFFEKIQKVYIQMLINGRINFEESNVSYFLEKYLKSLIVQDDTIMENALGNCYIRYCGSGIKIIEVDPEGYFNRCGRYATCDEVSKIGDIFKKDVFSLKVALKNLKFLREKDRALKELNCDTCIARDICDTGCMAFHYVKYGKFGIRKDLVCEDMLKFKKYIMDNETEIFKAFFNFKQKSVNDSYNINVYFYHLKKVGVGFDMLTKACKIPYRLNFREDGYIDNIEIGDMCK